MSKNAIKKIGNYIFYAKDYSSMLTGWEKIIIDPHDDIGCFIEDIEAKDCDDLFFEEYYENDFPQEQNIVIENYIIDKLGVNKLGVGVNLFTEAEDMESMLRK